MNPTDDGRDRPPPGAPPPANHPPTLPDPIDDDATRAIRPFAKVPPRAAPAAPAAADYDDDSTRVVGPGALAQAFPKMPDDATRIRPVIPGAGQPVRQSSPATSLPPTSPTGPLPGHTTSDGEAQAALGTPADATVRQVGRYQIQSRLGRGGMATVYKAHDPSIGRDVAVKFLHASLAEDEDCRARFLRESRAAGGLSHPNIVVVHDVGEIEGRPYMAMELVDGTTLADVLDLEKRLPIRDAVVIGLQLARALEYAHARGIVHRDIKPGNIMLLREGRTVKVADFGIAHMDDGGQQRTQVGAVLGTPQYMSPEQTRGDKLDGRSDLFSAGIVIYQMLAGERPFRGESLVAVATQIANAEPPSLAQKRPEVPSSLRRVVERCLAKQPPQRYQSGRELSDALKKVLVEIDETARQRNKPRIIPLRVKWALTMAAVVALVMGVTATLITQRQQAAMMDQVLDYGASLARFIARQNAAAVLNGEEWEAVDVAVQEIMKTRNFERVSVIDRTGTVRVSSVAALVGQPYKPESTATLGTVGSAVAAIRYISQGEPVLGFETPVLFADKEVGRVALGIPEKPLTRVANLSITLMIVLAVVTVLAVAIAMYFVADWFSKPIRLLEESMDEIAKGRFDHRIGEKRNDEFGQLYIAFDTMAQALQRREGSSGATPSTLTPQTLALARRTETGAADVPPGASSGAGGGESP